MTGTSPTGFVSPTQKFVSLSSLRQVKRLNGTVSLVLIAQSLAPSAGYKLQHCRPPNTLSIQHI